MVDTFLHFTVNHLKCLLQSRSLLYLQKPLLIFSDSNNTKFVLDRINQTEKYLGNICGHFGKVCRKEARLRDCHDDLVQNMFEFADREKINTSLRQSLQQYASYLSAVEDYRNTLVSRFIETNDFQMNHHLDYTNRNSNT